MLGKKIKQVRKELGLTQVELASKLNISRSYLGDIECGRTKGTMEIVDKISNLSGKPIDWFTHEDSNDVKIELYDVLDRTVDLMLENGMIKEDGSMNEYAKEILGNVLEKEIKLKIERMK